LTKEEKKEYRKGWLKAHPNYYKAYLKAWREAHPNYSKEHYQSLKAGKMRPTIFSRIKAITPAFFRNLIRR
jgi:hypothetical protein